MACCSFEPLTSIGSLKLSYKIYIVDKHVCVNRIFTFRLWSSRSWYGCMAGSNLCHSAGSLRSSCSVTAGLQWKLGRWWLESSGVEWLYDLVKLGQMSQVHSDCICLSLLVGDVIGVEIDYWWTVAVSWCLWMKQESDTFRAKHVKLITVIWAFLHIHIPPTPTHPHSLSMVPFTPSTKSMRELLSCTLHFPLLKLFPCFYWEWAIVRPSKLRITWHCLSRPHICTFTPCCYSPFHRNTGWYCLRKDKAWEGMSELIPNQSFFCDSFPSPLSHLLSSCGVSGAIFTRSCYMV